MSRRQSRRRGFTLIEILIAIVVLVLGITGIVALFPTAIESGNQTVEDTYAATITQSVVDSISVGIRESRYSHRSAGTNRVWTYFLMNHDGVLFEAVETPEDYADTAAKLWARDFCVLLPQSSVADNYQSANEPTFVFPAPAAIEAQVIPFRDADTENPPGSLTHADLFIRKPGTLDGTDFTNMDGVDPANFQGTTSAGTPTRLFARVFHLGRFRRGDPGVDPTEVGVIRPEFRGEAIDTGGSTTVETIAVDPYPNYSYAFTIKRARLDTHRSGAPTATPDPDGSISADDRFSNSLFELKIYVFKNFDDVEASRLLLQATGVRDPIPRSNRAVREFITLISL